MVLQTNVVQSHMDLQNKCDTDLHGDFPKPNPGRQEFPWSQMVSLSVALLCNLCVRFIISMCVQVFGKERLFRQRYEKWSSYCSRNQMMNSLPNLLFEAYTICSEQSYSTRLNPSLSVIDCRSCCESLSSSSHHLQCTVRLRLSFSMVCLQPQMDLKASAERFFF